MNISTDTLANISKTTGQMRTKLLDTLYELHNGTISNSQARERVRICAEINKSLYVECKLYEAGMSNARLGQTVLNNESIIDAEVESNGN